MNRCRKKSTERQKEKYLRRNLRGGNAKSYMADTNEEAWRLTGIVLAFTAVFSLFLGGSLDWIWSNMFEYNYSIHAGAVNLYV